MWDKEQTVAENFHQIRRAADVMPIHGGEEYSFSEPPRESLVDILRDRFGGRWKLMVTIAAPLSLLCALVGWISGTQTYQSSGRNTHRADRGGDP